MKIYAFKDPRFEKPVPGGIFEVLINPETYSYEYKIKYNDKQAPGTSAKELKFDKIEPRTLDFEILFDNTGILREVKDNQAFLAEIHQFRDLLLSIDGDIHRPPFLKINWGNFLVRCCLLSLNIQFKLFRPDGAPIRAIAKASFHEFVEDNLRAAKDGKNSPDLTHVRVVKFGDTLPLMTYRIYGDPRYYPEVARINHLQNFRKLTPGQTLIFPPLKNEA
ncbi:MAG: LysM peptidoglycan-binding domain-containing protein [Saprospiraceae bacterium]